MAKNRINSILLGTWKRCYSNSKPNIMDPLQERAMSERCIVTDENDRKIGFASKYDCHRIQNDGSIILHRAFSLFLFNSLGEMLVQQRAPGKVTFPNYVSNACCSHPIEEYPEELIEEDAHGVKAAAIRRLNYELGIPKNEMNLQDFNYLTRIHYKSNDCGEWGEHELDYILFLQKDLTLKPNENEVGFVEYVSRQNFSNYVKSLQYPLTPWFKFVSNSLLLQWWDNLANLDQFKDHKNIKRFV